MRILDDDPRKLEVRHNREWLDMPMADLLGARAHDDRGAAARARGLRQTLAGRRSRSRCSSCSTRCCRAMTPSRSTRTSSSGGPTRSSTCCSGATSSAHYGRPQQAIMTMPILVGHRRHAQDVEVARATRSASPTRRRRCSARRWRSPTRRWASTTGCSSTARSPDGPVRGVGELGRELGAGCQARARARDRRLAALAGGGREGRGRIRPGLRPARAAAGDRGGELRPPRATSTCPALIAERVRDLALGGAAADRAGRRVARRGPARRRGAGAGGRARRRAGAAGRPAALPAPAGVLSRPGFRLASATLPPAAETLARPDRASDGALRAGTAARYTPSVGPQAPSGAGSDRSPPKEAPFGKARRSLKTQQHAHLRSDRDRGVRPGSTRPTGALRALAWDGKESSREVPRHGSGPRCIGPGRRSPSRRRQALHDSFS